MKWTLNLFTFEIVSDDRKVFSVESDKKVVPENKKNDTQKVNWPSKSLGHEYRNRNEECREREKSILNECKHLCEIRLRWIWTRTIKRRLHRHAHSKFRVEEFEKERKTCPLWMLLLCIPKQQWMIRRNMFSLFFSLSLVFLFSVFIRDRNGWFLVECKSRS